MDKLNDCYFYFYSTCTKGNLCPFRHCDLALGSEVVCESWRIGRCKDRNCTFRHMEPNINRSQKPCWFETQPMGCRKPHCVFQHSKNRPTITELQNSTQEYILPTSKKLPSVNILKNIEKNSSESGEKSPNPETKICSKSEPINISIERDEESDDPDNHLETHISDINDEVDKVKSLEQIRMEKILNSSLDDLDTNHMSNDCKSNDNRQILKRQIKNIISTVGNGPELMTTKTEEKQEACNFVIKSLDQIRKEREEMETAENSDKVQSDDKEKPALKENQTPNLLKRSHEDSYSNYSPTKPIKIRRNRVSTTVQLNLNSSDSQSDDFSKEKVNSPNSCLSNSIDSTDVKDNNNSSSSKIDFEDFEFLSGDGMLDTNNGDNNTIEDNLEDDELMREINQVINS